MRNALLVAASACLAAQAVAADLTERETRWLSAGMPVLEYAQQQKLPIDVVVQPQATAGQSPLAMAFVDGRCKLVLSMRDNPQADSALEGVAPELRGAIIESMTAHEVGHCWRHVNGAWNTLPAGFSELPASRNEAGELAQLRRDMQATRREEGFADLVGLAWTLQQRPAEYAHVHAWLEQARSYQPAAGGHHDTRVWVALAKDRAAFDTRAASPFEQARVLWQRGLLSED